MTYEDPGASSKDEVQMVCNPGRNPVTFYFLDVLIYDMPLRDRLGLLKKRRRSEIVSVS